MSTSLAGPTPRSLSLRKPRLPGAAEGRRGSLRCTLKASREARLPGRRTRSTRERRPHHPPAIAQMTKVNARYAMRTAVTAVRFMPFPSHIAGPTPSEPS